MARSSGRARATLTASALAGVVALTGCGGISLGPGSAGASSTSEPVVAQTDPATPTSSEGPAPTTSEPGPDGTTAGPTPAPSTTVPVTPTSQPTPEPSTSTKPTPKPTPTAGDTLHRGDTGAYVEQVQQRLSDLGYWNGSADGSYGDLTAQAVMALQKAAGLGRDGVFGPATRRALEAGVRPSSRLGGTGIEIDKARQLLLVVRGGKVTMVLNTSTGSGEQYTSQGTTRIATTPSGSYSTYRSVDRLHKGPLGDLWRPRYFNGGIAVHGSASVPGYPASHGCARVSNPAMNMIWARQLMPIGGRVVVY